MMGKRDAPKPTGDDPLVKKLKISRKRFHFPEDDSSSDDSWDELVDENEAGIIEKICLKNFMCHSNLEFVFGPHINFVIGRNGSGKSAVLNAIILVLGGKSHATGRNANFKGFIQEGKQFAEIIIALRNGGADAYHPDVFGDRIVIERRLDNNGHSSYKLKNSSGKVISSKKEDLKTILDALNIQIENPVSVLTQDASKCFLQSKGDKKKYELFYKATQLEKIYDGYRESESAVIESEATLKRKSLTLEDNHREVDRLGDMVKRINLFDNQTARRAQLENEFLWADVKEYEEEAEELQKEKVVISQKLDKNKEKKTEFEKLWEDHENNRRKLKHQNSKCNDELVIHKNDLDASVQKGKELQQGYRDVKHLMDIHDRKLNQSKRDVRNLEMAIHELKEKMKQDAEMHGRERQKKIDKFEQSLADIEDRIRVTSNSMNELTEKNNQSQESYQNQILEINHCKESVRNFHSQLEKMKASQRNIAAKFHPKMPELLACIAAEMKKAKCIFKKEPLGPIGMFLSLKDRKWSFPVEVSLSRIVSSFCCDNFHDRSQLLNLMRKVFGVRNWMPGIIVSEFLPRVHDVTKFKVVTNKYLTIFDVISCDIPPILNCVIDQLSLENILLIEHPTEASDVMSTCPPKNCKLAYTLKGDRVFPSPKFKFYSHRGNSNHFSLAGSYTEEEVENKKGEMQCFIQRIQELESSNKSLMDVKRKNERHLETLRQNNSKLTKDKYDIEELLKDVRDRVVENDLTVQEDDLKSQLKHREKMKNDYDELKSKRQTIIELINANKEKEDEKQKSFNTMKETNDQLALQLEDLECKKIELERKMSLISKSIVDLELQLRKALDRYNKAKAVAQKKVDDAIKQCPRIDVKRKSSIIKDEILKLEKALQEHLGDLNRDEIINSYVEKKKMLENTHKEIDTKKMLHEKLQQSLGLRWNRFKEIQTSKALKVQYSFQEKMTTRNYYGNLKFDHENKTLQIVANPRKGNKSDMHQTTSLSGGERSFLQVSLLLALYSTTDMPFHILDEYDVFMDSMNKDMSMKIMMEMASCMKNNQFIFLSPLDLPSTIDRSKVKIHKMPDPERTVIQECEDN